jgi:putative salt-induced outer membrane protein YdiY
MIKALKLFILICFFLQSLAVSAGKITLKNGDIIHGELQAIQKDNIVWSSNIFGDITLPKNQVTQLTSSTVLPINTNSHEQATTTTNCSFELKNELEDQMSVLCDTGEQKGLALKDVVTIKARPAPPPFKGDVKFGYNQKSGNTDSEELDVAISAQWIQQQFRHELGLAAESDSSEGNVTDEKYTADYKLNYDFDDHWFTYGQVKYEKNRFSAIEEQYQVGAGIGHKLILDNELHINAQLGTTYLSTKRPSSDSDNGSNDKDIAGRWTLKLDWPIPNSNITAFHHHELLWIADAIDDNQLESSTGIKIPLFGGIFSELRYDFDHVSEPASEQQHADHEWVISVGYKW